MATAINHPSAPEMLLAGVNAAFAAALQPDPELTISQWSDEYRVLSRVSAGEPGRWRTSRTPFLREIIDCLSPSSPYSRVAFMKPAQITIREPWSQPDAISLTWVCVTHCSITAHFGQKALMSLTKTPSRSFGCWYSRSNEPGLSVRSSSVRSVASECGGRRRPAPRRARKRWMTRGTGCSVWGWSRRDISAKEYQKSVRRLGASRPTPLKPKRLVHLQF